MFCVAAPVKACFDDINYGLRLKHRVLNGLSRGPLMRLRPGELSIRALQHAEVVGQELLER